MGDTFQVEENQKLIESFRKEMMELNKLQGGLMPILQLAQKTFGYLPEAILKIISEDTRIPLAEIYGVATFYSEYSLEPKGKFNVDVCTGTSCYALGGESLLAKVEDVLGIKVGTKTEDGHFYLSSAKCHGLCALSPVMTVNEDVYVNVNPDEVEEILNKYR